NAGAQAEAGNAGAQAEAGNEVRGLWVVRTSLTSPASVLKMVAAADNAGINALFVQVRGRGDAYYASALEPRGALLANQPKAFDPLALVIREAHARGIAVHAWVNVGLVADAPRLPAAATHIVRQHPEWLMVPRELAAVAARTRPRDPSFVSALARWTRANIAKVEGLYVSPIPRAAREHAASLARDLTRRYAVDGLHLDYVRYPHDGFDYSAAALAEFRAAIGADLEPAALAALDARARTAPALFTDRFPQRWNAFRRERVTAVVAAMASAARQERPGIIISAAVVPDPAAALAGKLQDWPAWASRGIVDALCPMAYAEDRGTFTAQVDAVHNAAGRVPVWTGIGAYRLTAIETASRIREAREAGSAGVVLFSYDSVSSGRAGHRYLTDVARAAFSILSF
ncbi:MAG: family 10 glycosylhydrolase, partial [Vicinamibacterales bacterium]